MPDTIHPPAASAARPLLERRRFQLCVAAIIKNEAGYIEEWICYHRALGVEHFFIFDNNSDDDIRDVLKPYLSHGLVTLLHWPLLGGQVDAYNFALRFFGAATEWMAFIDVDEFIVPKLANSLPELLAELGDADQLLIPWRNFGFSGHRARPPGLVIESYTQAENIPPGGFAEIHAKAIVRPRAAAQVEPHHSTTLSKASVDGSGAPVPEQHLIAKPSYERIQINHYYYKSWEEFEAKIRRGQVSGGAEKTTIPFDTPGFSTEDKAALRFVERTKAMLAEMRRLAPDPFRYGSRLALADFPRRDPFHWAARVALSNHLAGKTTLRVGIPIELANLAAGSDLVVRANDYGGAAAVASLETSLHVRDLVRRVRGEIVCSLATGRLEKLQIERCRLATRPNCIAVIPQEANATLAIRHLDADAERCYALVLGVRVPAAASLELAPRPEPGGNEIPAKPLVLPNQGDYLGILELNREPRRISAIELRFKQEPPEILLFDLMLVAYG